MQSSMCSGMIFVECSPSSPSWAVIPKYSGTFHSTPSVVCAISLHLWSPSEISTLYLCMDFHPCWLIPKLPVFMFTHEIVPFCVEDFRDFPRHCSPPQLSHHSLCLHSFKHYGFLPSTYLFLLIYLLSQILCCGDIFQKHKLSALGLVGIEFPIIWMVLLPDN